MNECRCVLLLWLNGSLSNVWHISMISWRSWRCVPRRLKFVVVTRDSDGCVSALHCVHRLRLSDLAEKLTLKHGFTTFSRGSSESLRRALLVYFYWRWSSRFNKRVLRSHPNVWTFIERFNKGEVISRQMMLKFTNGDQKKKTEAILAHEVRLKTLSTRTDDDEVARNNILKHSHSSWPVKNKLWFYSNCICIFIYFVHNTISCQSIHHMLTITA